MSAPSLFDFDAWESVPVAAPAPAPSPARYGDATEGRADQCMELADLTARLGNDRLADSFRDEAASIRTVLATMPKDYLVLPKHPFKRGQKVRLVRDRGYLLGARRATAGMVGEVVSEGELNPRGLLVQFRLSEDLAVATYCNADDVEAADA